MWLVSHCRLSVLFDEQWKHRLVPIIEKKSTSAFRFQKDTLQSSSISIELEACPCAEIVHAEFRNAHITFDESMFGLSGWLLFRFAMKGLEHLILGHSPFRRLPALDVLRRLRRDQWHD